MGDELAFVLINPYTIAKSRTGGVIARYIGRTDLNMVAARMFAPSAELAARYSRVIHENVKQSDPAMAQLLSDYVAQNYGPDPDTGKPRRVLLMLFEGPDAIRKIRDVTGSASLKRGSGETVRDTYGDYIVDRDGSVRYFEPAVLVGRDSEGVARTLRLWASYSKSDGGVVDRAFDVPAGEKVEKTLVLLKPDNFKYPSFRPGTIIDLLSSSGLRIVAVKKFKMTVAQAEEFYGPVRDALRAKFKEFGPRRCAEALSRELGFSIPEHLWPALGDLIAPVFANAQFDNIVQYMTGFRPSECSEAEKSTLAREGCLALVYDGVDAVQKIRSIVGTTDPHKARPGSVRREFGSDVMMNAAHASDSVENAEREMRIIRIGEDTISPIVAKHYGTS